MSERDQQAGGRLAEHFEDLGKQEHALRLGMWIFLASELLLFAGLFAIYTAYRSMHPVDFERAFDHNLLWAGTTNTVVLIVSSFTIAWGIHAFRHDRRRTALVSLTLTVLLGLAFLGIKAYEYGDHFQHGIYPGPYYSFEDLPSSGARLFFTLYYFMTGLHALHMVGGVALVLWVTRRLWRRRLYRDYHPELELTGLYWHLVDSIWIFLWPLFYLTG